MNPAEYARMHALETDYWWFVGRRAVVRQLLAATFQRLHFQNPRLLDLGCGTGANLPMLTQLVGPEGQVVGLDYSPLALNFARSQVGAPNLFLTQGDGLNLPIGTGWADCVTLFDVLEHLSDDHRALAEVHRVLRPGGALVLSVPAYQHLWSAHDEALHHFRRYERAGLNALLKSQGFAVWRLSFAMSLMPPLAWAWRRFVLPHQPRRPQNAQRHSEGAVLPQMPPVLNSLLTRYVEVEGRIIVKRPLRFGTSLVAVAVRSE